MLDISHKEIKKAIENLKNGKASGPSNISEPLKADLDTATEILHNLFEKKNFLTIGFGKKASSPGWQRKGTYKTTKTIEGSCCCLSMAKFSTEFF